MIDRKSFKSDRRTKKPPSQNRDSSRGDSASRPSSNRGSEQRSEDRRESTRRTDSKRESTRRTGSKRESTRRTGKRSDSRKRDPGPGKRKYSKRDAPARMEPESIRLNKFIAHAGICSRRDADTFIADGKVRVNGKVITELGFQVSPNDRITVSGQKIEPEPFVYILMNKPRDTITTTSDEKGRKTVMDLIENATGQRVYPVGRLDRNTTGLILLTNDGDLANRLMHPSYKVRKVYDVETNRMLTDEELYQLRTGIPLEDGPAKAYRVSRHPEYLNVVTLSMHEGRNRVVRRMMEAMGVEVRSLDRVAYGSLHKKGVRSGRWRNLRKSEINELRKMVRLLPLDHLNRS